MLTSITAIGAQGARVDLDPARLLSPEAQEHVRVEANAWIKRLRLVPFDDVPMRDRFTFRGDSLWWFTEIYLHKMRRIDDALATLATLEAAVDVAAPAQLRVTCAGRASTEAARAFARARGLAVDVADTTAAPARVDAGWLVGASAWLSRLRPSMRPAGARARLAAFVHTAFWRETATGGRESYIGDVLAAVRARVEPDDLRLVGLGPRRTFRTRRWWDPVVPGAMPQATPIERYAPRAALRESTALWRDRDRLARAITSGEAIREAARVGGCDLWPILSAELADAARIQWTWSARAMDEARAALQAIAPDVAITYAEAGGWGRALVLEARRLGIPTVGIQHGFIYRHWLNYRHEADELEPHGTDAGFPLPTRTLLFDRHAQATLETTGHVPSAALAVTGSPRLDEFVARIESVRASRDAIRRELGLAGGDRLLVLAAKASEIGPHLGALMAAVPERPGIRLVIKPHPAESREAYLPYVPPGAPVDVQAPHADLGRLLAVADGLVTMNSTVAIDGLVLGVPALVIGLPSNLSPFVEAGVMLGATGDDIPAALGTLLYDRQARQALLERARAFAAAHGMQADGGAARRAADQILALTAGPGDPA
ncbi:MAG: hypothetical protein ABS36_13435 [Acidobacteria bacterium SCN 69-37]|nr:MAG: hypothetical protein ABS36_13435 [Acidobacteria bacterium SCN 69-37]